MLKNIKSHTGFYSCERCEIRGNSVDHRLVFPFSNPLARFRNDREFKAQAYPEHQKGVSQIVRSGIDISLIDAFPLDYMHLVCLGVVKKILTFLNDRGNAISLAPEDLSTLSERLEGLKMPREFARQPRSLKDLRRFKATEFRQFLLYTGPVFLKDLLETFEYKHFLYLMVGISVLLDEDATFRLEHLSFAQENILNFVRYAEPIYGKNFMSYNTHCLIHIADDVAHFNCSLNDISAFPFEDHLMKLKKYVRKGDKPIVQMIKKIKALENANLDQTGIKNKKMIIHPEIDCYFLLEDHIAIVDRVEEHQNNVWCNLYEKTDLDSLFLSPCNSKVLDIYFLQRNTNYVVERLHNSRLTKKMVGITTEDGTALLKLRHV